MKSPFDVPPQPSPETQNEFEPTWDEARKELGELQKRLEDGFFYGVDDTTRETYANMLASFPYETAPEDIRFLYRDIFGYMTDILESNMGNLDSELVDFSSHMIDMYNSAHFAESLDILGKMEHFPGANYLMESLEHKAQNPKANMLLSRYVEKIAENTENNDTSIHGFEILQNHEVADDVVKLPNGKYIWNLDTWGHTIRFSNAPTAQLEEFVQKRSSMREQLNVLKKQLEDQGIRIDDFGGQASKKNKSGKNEKILQEYKHVSEEFANLDGQKRLLFTQSPTESDLKAGSSDSLKPIDQKIFALLWTSHSFRTGLEKDLGVSFSSLGVPEQQQFLEYATQATNEDFIPITKFTHTYGAAGFKTFLSLEHGGKDMGDKILTLGEKLPKGSAEVLFKKYGEIIDEANSVAEYLAGSLGEKATPELVGMTREHLLFKGRDLLSYYAGRTEICKEQECEDLGRELEHKLGDMKASLLLFASATKTLVERGNFSFEDLKDTDLALSTGELDSESQKEMEKIFIENRPAYSPALLEDTLQDFRAGSQHPQENQSFYILRTRGDIVAFMRLDDMPDGSVHGASFNVRPELRGSAIGSELLKKVIEEKSKIKPFKVECYAQNPMLARYTSDFGFTIAGTIENYHGTGETFYELVREPRKITQ